MKALLIVLLLTTVILAPAQTKDDRWIRAACSDAACIYYDKKTIERSGDIVTVWTRVRYFRNWPKPICDSSNATPMLSVLKEQYNCSTRKSRASTLR